MSTPAQIFGSDLYAWYRAADVAPGHSVGDLLPTWTDASGKGHALSQATSAYQPTLQQVTNNGKTFYVVRLDGIDDGLRETTSNLPQPSAVAVILKPTLTSQLQYVFDGYSVATTRNMLQAYTTPNWRGYAGSALLGPTATSTWAVVLTIFSGTGSSIRVNGNTPTSGDAGTQAAGSFTLGKSFSDIGPIAADVAEVIRIGRLPSAADIAALDSYVQDTYGITVADYKAPVTGSGGLTPGQPSLSGSGTILVPVTGDGDLTAASGSLSGAGGLSMSGGGTITADAPTVTGLGTLTIVGAGQLAAQAAILAGSGAFLRDITLTVGPARTRTLTGKARL